MLHLIIYLMPHLIIYLMLHLIIYVTPHLIPHEVGAHVSLEGGDQSREEPGHLATAETGAGGVWGWSLLFINMGGGVNYRV